ncbi:ACT domain-containing protein [Cokeromyces recurvatus]|uniref:ACT domain-containing protein n=1 Tax=Cokeromyces recurvatus TaxID=90255 RepID=UPI00222070FB|nr:ACT domain-containing protein [Cokeromyces recurvatus]KAI7900237.1 ACT domain-containing protein [Cokeromyces recurvatus]
MTDIQLKILPEAFSIYQYEHDFKLSSDIFDAPWYTISRTKSELSIILPTLYKSSFIHNQPPKKSEHGWRMFQVDAQMDFSLVGILARIITPLKNNQIPVFVVSTFDTDYVMVKEDKLTESIKTLSNEPNIIVKPGEPVL